MEMPPAWQVGRVWNRGSMGENPGWCGGWREAETMRCRDGQRDWDQRQRNKTPERHREKQEREMGFPGGSVGKEFACNVGYLGSTSGLGRSPGEGNGYPLQYSGLENSVDCIVQGVAKSGTRLNDFNS